MKSLVIYDSEFGNTEQIAQVVANRLGEFGQARTLRVEIADPQDLEGIDLLVLGSPTQGWRATQPFKSFVDLFPEGSMDGLPAAVFDTRFKMTEVLTGSAAKRSSKQLRKLGLELLLPPESFFVKSKEGPLYEGELERAASWAVKLAETYQEKHPDIVLQAI